MKIQRVTISNHRAFWPSLEVDLDRHVTVLMGRNNSGKSAFLSSIGRTIEHKPHRSPSSIPHLGEKNHVPGELVYRFSIDKDEIREALYADNQHVTIALDHVANIKEDRIRLELRHIAASEKQEYTATIQLTPQPSEIVVPHRLASAPTPREFTVARLQPNHAAQDGFDVGNTETCAWPPSLNHPSLRIELGAKGFDVGFRRVFRFLPERRPQAKMTIERGRELKGDASNLVSVLDLLKQHRDRFDYYQECVRRLIPDLGEIRLETEEPGQKSIQIAFSESKKRLDLTFGADELGTGTMQTLALVYAITMSDHPRVILIDEPSNFLHPGAARELLRLAARHSQHQYIIASHSPLVLEQFPSAALVLLDRNENGGAVARNLKTAEVDDQKLLLRELGLSAPDIFGADRIVWVEGPTEREVYTAVSQQATELPRGTVFLPLVATGDLEGKTKALAVEVYRRLTAGIGLAPSRVAFLLDLEDRDDAAVKELQSLLGNLAFFSPGRMLENSFLDSALIADFLSRTSQSWNGSLITISADLVEAVWNELLDVKRYLVAFKRTDDTERWRSKVHAGHVLRDTVEKLTDQRFEYRKVQHGLQLIQRARAMSLACVSSLRDVALASSGVAPAENAAPA